MTTSDSATETATFGAGCFWCVEAVFKELQGVQTVESGYSNGEVDSPTYEQVCRGDTGHAEVVQITYDPAVISFDTLLEVFWKTHDPTTLNRQGADRGTQYRSAVFHHSEGQREKAEHYKRQLNEAGAFDQPVVTEIAPIANYHPAETYHQDYYALNPQQGYCAAVIRPKVEKVRQAFAEKVNPR